MKELTKKLRSSVSSVTRVKAVSKTEGIPTISVRDASVDQGQLVRISVAELSAYLELTKATP